MSTIKSSAENLTLNADGANNDVIIQSNGSTKVTVDGATGNVGVGQTTPASNNSSPRVLHIGSSGDSKASIVLEENGSTGSNTWEILSDDELQIRRGSSQKMYFKTDGLAVFNNGVALGGTGAANTLDDYEEGTWTPTITANSGGSVSYTTQLASYTKVGNLVSVTCQLDFTKNTSSGNYAVAGQPFNFTTNICKGQGYDWYNPSGTALMNTHIHVDPNGSTFRLYCNTGTSVDATALPFTSSLVSSRCVIRFSLTYQTA
tara:strand:+ start:544 stop:1323 length:780 start_codon:yes stop_codon:yes gene_type:complete